MRDWCMSENEKRKLEASFYSLNFTIKLDYDK